VPCCERGGVVSSPLFLGGKEMKRYIVNVEVKAVTQESLQHDRVGAVKWTGTMHIAGIADDFHTTGETSDQVIERIGIELISVLQARYAWFRLQERNIRLSESLHDSYHKEKEQG